MIYRICINDHDIYGPDLEHAVLSPSLEVELNSAGSLSFTLPPEHEDWQLPNVFIDEVDVYEDDDIIWFGRPLATSRDWNNQKKVVCEGALAYFNDSIQRPKEYKISNTTNHSFFRSIIDIHNSQMVQYSNRIIEVGNITIEEDAVYRKVDYNTTADCLQQYCLDTDGGYFVLRKERDQQDPTKWHRYIDWLKDLNEATDQKVQFGLNMLDINQDLNGSDICTVLIATGADDLTLANVATKTEDGVHHVNGSDELIFVGAQDPTNPEGIYRYGRVLKQKDWSDATTKSELYQKAKEWLIDQNTDIPTIECSAADLHYIEGHEQEGKFKVGQMVEVISVPHGIGPNYTLPMYKISMNLDSGVKRITIGTPPKRELTDIVAPSKTGTGSTRGSGGSGSSSGGDGGGGSTVDIPVKDVRLKKPGEEEFKSVVKKKIAKIDLSDLGAGTVTDVEVDGVSVVDLDGIAHIVIPVSDVQLDGVSVISDKIANFNSSDFGTTVVANPIQTATSNLNKLQVGNIVYGVTGGGGGQIYYIPTLYSFQEQEVGVWVDGKPLYQITQYYSSVTKGTTNYINHGIQNVDTIFCIDASCKYDGRNEVLKIPYISTNANYHITFSNITPTQFLVAPGSGFTSIHDIYVTFCYTKTTDTPGSGSWTPDGRLKHRYSTTEQEVGVWVDGNKLYEIAVVTGGSIPSGGTLIERRPMTGYDILLYTS